MRDPADDAVPLDYATPRIAPANQAWQPGDENKALAEGCASLLLLTVIFPVLLVAVVVVAIVVLAFVLMVFAR